MSSVTLPLRVSLYTDVVLFFFSFFSKTSASARAKRACENKRGARDGKITLERLFSSSPTPTPLARAVNKSLVYHARLTDFEEKLEGLWTGYLRVSITCSLHCLTFVVFSYRRIISFAIRNVLSQPEFTYRNLLYPKAYYCIKLDHQCMPN